MQMDGIGVALSDDEEEVGNLVNMYSTGNNTGKPSAAGGMKKTSKRRQKALA